MPPSVSTPPIGAPPHRYHLLQYYPPPVVPPSGIIAPRLLLPAQATRAAAAQPRCYPSPPLVSHSSHPPPVVPPSGISGCDIVASPAIFGSGVTLNPRCAPPRYQLLLSEPPHRYHLLRYYPLSVLLPSGSTPLRYYSASLATSCAIAPPDQGVTPPPHLVP